jgi:hypothetical protein
LKCKTRNCEKRPVVKPGRVICEITMRPMQELQHASPSRSSLKIRIFLKANGKQVINFKHIGDF